MSFQSEELLKYLPVEIQYQEIKASEEAYRQLQLSQARGRICCFGLSLAMAIAILHPGINQWFETKLQLTRISGISVSTINQPKRADKIAAALINYARSRNWEVRTGKRRYNVFYVQGMFPSGVRNNNTPNKFNDSRFLVEVNPTPKLVGAWEASIEPGNYYTKQPMKQEGAAQIQVPGQYRAWRIGKHKGREIALIQVAPVHIIRDFNRNSKIDKLDKKEYSIIGANQHSGSDQKFVDNSSAGCPVGRTVEGHQEFMSYLQKDVDFQANDNFIFSTGFVQSKSLGF
ncbi:peptidoglycan binding domain-containing protein [Calothrix parasitica NIES-267]|uniref:Peptidoglycan binding domain-containing protein n=1 Tax=Calothrix parasitica NIES-267 TaxID=1973488 RepID=A0A1Z4LT13_9CYAN|nr:peptidoglycan binding domain-containing protein [Calothrix parasitica NIES-267]